MAFGDRLQSLRRKNGMTQEEFAEQLKVSRQAVSKWESCRGYPEMEKILYICSRYGVSMDELFADELPRPTPETRPAAPPEPLPSPGPAIASESTAPAAESALAPSAEPLMLSKSAAGAALPPATEAALRPTETDSPSPGVIGAVSSEVISHGSHSRRALSSTCRTDCSRGSA